MTWTCSACLALCLALCLTCPASAARHLEGIGAGQVLAHDGTETLESYEDFQDQEDSMFGIIANQSEPVPYVDYITGCSGNSDCFFDARRAGCHCDNWGCLDEGTRHPDPFKKSIHNGANEFCYMNPSLFSMDRCLCNVKLVIRHERNVRYRQQLLDEKMLKDKLTPANVMKDLESKLNAKWQRLKKGSKHSIAPLISQLSSQDPIVAVFHVCTEMKDIPIVDASHCGVIFQTESDTYYVEYATGSLGSSKTGLPGSVRGKRVGNGDHLNADGLAKVMWNHGYAPMKKKMQYFEVFQSETHMKSTMTPFDVGKWVYDYAVKYPYYSLTFHNCQHFSGKLTSKIRGIEFKGSRDLINYYKLIALGVGHGLVPGLSGALQGMGS